MSVFIGHRELVYKGKIAKELGQWQIYDENEYDKYKYLQ